MVLAVQDKRPDRGAHLEAFYGCLYYATPRPSEAVMLRAPGRLGAASRGFDIAEFLAGRGTVYLIAEPVGQDALVAPLFAAMAPRPVMRRAGIPWTMRIGGLERRPATNAGPLRCGMTRDEVVAALSRVRPGVPA